MTGGRDLPTFVRCWLTFGIVCVRRVAETDRALVNFVGLSENCARRVARPISSGKTPVAIGSRVPRWPTFLVSAKRRVLLTTSCEVHAGRACRRPSLRSASPRVTNLALGRCYTRLHGRGSRR